MHCTLKPPNHVPTFICRIVLTRPCQVRSLSTYQVLSYGVVTVDTSLYVRPWP